MAVTSSKTSDFCAGLPKEFVIPVCVNGMETTAYRDTGAECVLVNSNFVRDTAITGSWSIAGINDDAPREIPTTMITLSSPLFGKAILVEAGLVKNLKWNVLLGNDFFKRNNVADIIAVRKKADLIVAIDRDKDENKTETCVERQLKITDQNCMQSRDDSRSSDTEHPENPLVGTRKNCLRSHAARVDCMADQRHSERAGSATLTVDGSEHSNLKQVPHMTNARSNTILDKTETEISTTFDTVGGNVVQTRESEIRLIDATQKHSHDAPSVADKPVTERVNNADSRHETSPTVINQPAIIENNQLHRLAVVHNQRSMQAIKDNSQSQKLSAEQRTDDSLKHWFDLAATGSGEFIFKAGVLFRKTPPGIQTEHDYLLCLPYAHRLKVLATAHDKAESGNHFGYRRTLNKITNAGMTWPKCATEVKRYCESCEICARKSSRQNKDKVPLQPIPVVGNFGDSWVCDIVGPSLPPTQRRKNKHILVCVDAATRWIELFGIRNLKADTLADIFTNNLFARFGTPKSLVYDMQSSMMGELFQSVLRKLGIESVIALAGYHTATACAERQIRTVEQILKAYIHDFPKSWDSLLNHFAFNLNQQPCSTLGFSAQELVYGRNLRNALDQIRDDLLDVDQEGSTLKSNVVSYMTNLLNKIDTSNRLAKQHAELAQVKTKAWYDRNTKIKTFNPGDTVIVLVTDDARKLYARWSQPCKVIKRMGDRSYQIQMPDGRTSVRHVNCLRKFTPRTEYINVAIVESDTAVNEEDYHLPLIDWDLQQGNYRPKFRVGNHLPAEQQQQMLNLLNEYPDVFTNRLGCTHLLKHNIELTDETPCAQHAYRIADSLRKPVEDEIRRMLQAGVIRESISEYSAPMVPVLKPSGEVRITVNFKLLNSRIRDIKFPMSNPTDVLAKMAGKKYLSTIDLSKSFFQIELEENCKKFTAFQTHQASYEFNRCPMGLKTSSAP